MRAWVIGLGVIGMALATIGCGPGAASIPSHANNGGSSGALPQSGDFTNVAAATSTNGTDADVSVSADYGGTVEDDSTTFAYPMVVSLDGAVISQAPLEFNQTSISTTTTGATSATTGETGIGIGTATGIVVGAMHPRDAQTYFGESVVHLTNLAPGAHTVAISFGTVTGFTGSVPPPQSLGFTISGGNG